MLYPTWQKLRADLASGVTSNIYYLDGIRFCPQRMQTTFIPIIILNLGCQLLIYLPILVIMLMPLNYLDLSTVRNLYFAIKGTLQADQPDPVATFGYLPVIPGPAEPLFVGALSPVYVQNGMLFSNNPNPKYYTILGDNAQFGVPDSNCYFFGLVKPSLTGGKRVGYLYLVDCEWLDPLLLMQTGLYSPDPPGTPNPRAGREATNQVYSVFMTYLVTELKLIA